MVSFDSLLEILNDTFSVLVDRKNLATILISLICYQIWLMAFPLFGPIMTNLLVSMKALTIEKGRILQTFLVTMSLSSLGTGYIIQKTFKKTILIYFSAIAAALISFLFAFLNDFEFVIPITALLGLIAGVAPPALGTYFAEYTVPEDRGRIMSISIAVSIPAAYIFLVFKPVKLMGINHFEIIVVGIISLLSLTTLALKPRDRGIDEQKARIRGADTKQVILYSIPIILFYVVGGILFSIVFPTILDNISSQIFYSLWALPMLFSSIIAGIYLDTRGRRNPMIVGLAITGVSLGVLGILGIRVGYFTIITLAIGYSIMTVSSLIIWADLAPAKSIGLFYGMGFGLIWFAFLLGMTVSGAVFGGISESQIKSFMFFSAIILFISIPPLIIAKDALPMEIIEKRLMDRHLKQVLRLREKEERKNK